MAAYRESEEPRTQPRDLLLCFYQSCWRVWWWNRRPGPLPRFCSDACKQANYRARRRARTDAARAEYDVNQEIRGLWWNDDGRDIYLRGGPWRESWERLCRELANDPAPAEEAEELAKEIIFRTARVPEGAVPLPRAFRMAVQASHTDFGGDVTVFHEVIAAKELLVAAGLWA